MPPRYVGADQGPVIIADIGVPGPQGPAGPPGSGAVTAFSQLTGIPTTLAGYGITDAYAKTAADARYAPAAGPFPWADITGQPTTLAGYGITDSASSSRTITAGTGLSGGGDLTANRTLSLANTAVTANTYGDSTHVAQVTVDAQGRITAASSVAISGGGSVSSVFTRSGAVVATSGDYTVSQVTGAAPLASPAFTGTIQNTLAGTSTQSNLDAGLSFAAIQQIALYGSGGNYIPGLLWSTSDDNATKPKAGIYAQFTSSGSNLILGTSSSYSAGINHHVTISQLGTIAFGSPANLVGQLQVYDSQLTSATDNTTTHQSSIRIDMPTAAEFNGIDFAVQDVNPKLAFARIVATKGVSGSSIFFGVSNSYATGITSVPLTLNWDNSAQWVGTFTKYNNIATIGQGVAPLYAKVDLTAQAAAITATTVYAVPSTGAGLYRVSWSAVVTQAATSSSTLGGAGGFQLTFTDNDTGTAITPLSEPNATATGNGIGTQISGVVVVNAKASTNLQYVFGYTSSGATVMQYALHIKVEYLG